MATTRTTSTSPREDFVRLSYTSPKTVRKQGDTLGLRREVEAMEYVRVRTSIPIPRVLETRINKDEEEGWFVMERLAGEQLGEAWPAMSEGARAETLRQLKSYFEELHGIRPDGAGWIGSCSGGPAYDHRLTNMTTCGPFATVGEFHLALAMVAYVPVS